ncbi:MAG: hypothetical protein PHY14_02090 [Candidatus Gracilibacteria bacterium]|nr:hypothetical protein [Candidatus Gracilibacteria bacterium]
MASTSTFEINDTLQISMEQGFPVELDIEKHIENPFKGEEFSEKIFSFHGKSGLRNFVAYPVRVFLVENRNGKWIYWGLCQILETTIDYVERKTNGKYRVTKIFSPEEMKQMFALTHQNHPEQNYFS